MASAQTTVLPPALPLEQVLVRAPSSLWRDAWRRMLRNKFAVVSMIYIALLIVTALFANSIAPFSYETQDLDHTDESPTALHIFGTDSLGRDMFSRMVFGSRISLAVALVDVIIVLAVGVPLGLAAGYFGGWLDTIIMRTVDILFAFPNLLLIIVVITFIRALLDAPTSTLSQLVGPAWSACLSRWGWFHG